MEVILLMIMMLFFTTSCAGIGDWTSEPLAEKYVVQRSNSENVTLSYSDDCDFTVTTPVVEPAVTKVAINNDYIMVQRKDVISKFKDLSKIFKRYYYIVKLTSEQITGPYSKEDFEMECTKMGISDVRWKNVNSLKKQDDM